LETGTRKPTYESSVASKRHFRSKRYLTSSKKKQFRRRYDPILPEKSRDPGAQVVQQGGSSEREYSSNTLSRRILKFDRHLPGDKLREQSLRLGTCANLHTGDREYNPISIPCAAIRTARSRNSIHPFPPHQEKPSFILS
jgi:hypothetical protein